MREEKINGYIIKFYKNIAPDKELKDADKSQFFTWMNYDRMICTPIYENEGYHSYGSKSIDFSDISDIDIYHERHKVFLYYLHSDCAEEINLNIFEYDTHYAKNNPLFVFTFFTLNSDRFAIKDFKKKVKNLTCGQIESEIFGTLGSSSCVVVFRSNKYENVIKLLNKIRNSCEISSSYSIPGIIKNYNGINWGEKLDVNIRMVLNLNDISIEKFHRMVIDQNKNLCAFEDIKFYSEFGKHDAALEAKISDNTNFLKWYDKDGFFHLGENKYIQSTNTRILDLQDCAEQSSDWRASKYSNEICFKKIKNTIQNLQISENVRASFRRLLIRVEQLKAEPYYNKLEDKKNTILGFINSMPSNSVGEIVGDTAYGLDSLNNHIDNILSETKKDFERPQSSMRFIGPSCKLLLAYEKIVNVVLDEWLHKKDNKIEFTTILYANIDTAISIKELFKDVEYKKMGYVKE